MNKLVVAAAVAGVLSIAGALYLTRLADTPPYLMHDEVNFSLQAHAIATTGRDTSGRLLPVYFSEIGFEAGRDPLMIYWTALFLAVRPLSESAVRQPTALLAVLTIGAIFVVGRRMFGSPAAALIAAGLLLVTPGHFTNARLALSITYGIPAVLVWLWCVDRAGEGGRRWWFAAGACLGLGVYSYLASVIIMPALLLVAIGMRWQQGDRRGAGAMAAGFALLLVPMAGWLLLHPDRITNLLTAYAPTGGVTVTLRDRLTAFWMFFNPDYLFVSGDSRMTNSTRAAGLFPMAFAILLPIGLFRLARNDRGLTGRLVLAGFILAPIATAGSGRLDINRVLVAIPFGVLAATAGALDLFSRQGLARMAGAILVLSAAFQFTGFYRHYGGPYRVASSAWFGGDNRAAVNAVLDRVTVSTPNVYLDRRTPIERYWRFYAAARGRPDLAELPFYYDQNRADFAEARPGTLLVCESVERPCLGIGKGWTLLTRAIRVDGVVTHLVYVKDP